MSIRETQLRYWGELRDHVERSGKTNLPKAYEKTSNELLISIGGGDGIELRVWIDRREEFIAVGLYLTGSEKFERYETLLSMKNKVDASFVDQNLEWRAPDGRKAAYIAVIKHYVNPMDESDWPNQFGWLQRSLQRCEDVFRPIVKQL